MSRSIAPMGAALMFDVRQVARVLGGDITGRDSVNVPGPGHSKADRSLSIKINARAPGGFVVYSHAGDDPIECRDHVREQLGLDPWAVSPRRDRRTPFAVSDAGPDPTKERNKQFALRIWQQCVNPLDTIVEFYLQEHRDLQLPADVAGDVIRFHGSLYVDPQTRLPGMVCLLRNIETNQPCGIHRTYLDQHTGQKIDRKMFGVAKGAAVKFDPASTHILTIGEGIETVLSARAAGYAPAWALGSSGAVKNFPVLKRPAELTILEENDPTSREDVKVCAKRYLDARKPVNIITSHVGNDFNDAWRAMN
jgi:putative DNA primase/helicase